MNKQREKQLKVFGFGLPLIMVFLGVRHGLKYTWDYLSVSLFIVAAAFLMIALLSKPLLIKIFDAWMKVMHVVGSLVTGAILTIVYYVIFSPVSLILKLSGKDFMGRSQKKDAASYWIPRKETHSQDYLKQF
jgi:hypothetical protein